MGNLMNMPTLRFPEFSGEWDKKKLGEIGVNIIDGDRGTNYPNGNDFSDTGFCLFLNAKNVTKNGFSFISNSFITKEKDEKLRKGKLKDLDVVLTTRGSVGHIAFFNNKVSYKHLRINSGMVLIRTNSNFITPEYLYKYFNSNQIQNEIRKISFGSAQPQLTVGEIVKFKLAFPQLPEQQKIATFLTAVDSKIELLQKKKQGLEHYKKGVMQQLFTQQLRFKPALSEVEGDEKGNNYPNWEEKKLGEVLDYEQPTKYLVSSTEYDDSFDTPVLTAGKTFILGYTDETNNIFKDNLPVIIFDDFTTATQYVDFPFKAKSSAMKILVAKENENIKFIYEAMQNIRFEVGGHGRHWISKYATMKLDFPCPEEQTKIANFLSAIDAKIELVNTQLENTQQFKKGLLQQMFV